MPAKLEPLSDIDLRDALVVIAFPSVGSAGSIAAHFLQHHFDLPLVGHVRVAGLTGAVAVHNGIATSPIRVFGGELACQLDGECPHIYIVAAELELPQEVVQDAVDAVLSSARDGGARMVLALDAVRRQEDDRTPDVFVVATNEADKQMLSERTHADAVGRALLVGLTAELLHAGPKAGVRTGAILVEADEQLPDARAAAALVHALDSMIPEVKMDAQPLLAEAAAIEEQLRAAQEAVPAKPAPGTFI